jgi:ABC-type oligopeptide transport system ATPase subunit
VLFITHDLSLGNYLADQTVILRRGTIVERGATAAVFGDPVHPYTRALLSSVPRLGVRWRDADLDTDIDPGPCRYHALHPEGGPPLADVGEDHFVGCFGERECG